MKKDNKLIRELESDLKYLGKKRRRLIDAIVGVEKAIARLSWRIVKLKEGK